MSQWYYNKDGQAHGPLQTEALGEKIQASEVGPLDLVFEVGTSEWKALSQVPTLEAFIKKEEPEPEPAPAHPKSGETSEVPEWVLLKKVKVDGKSQFKQMGPYTKSHVLEFIDQGKLLFQDFIWKSGMESWQPVSEVETFKVPLPSSPPLETSIYQIPPVQKKGGSSSDDGDLGSLTELVEIEQYQREKTQMISADQLRKQWVRDDAGIGQEAQEDPGALWSLVPPTDSGVKKAPANKVDDSNSLFSLKKKGAPSPKAPAKKSVEAAPVEEPVVAAAEISAAPPEKIKKTQKKRKRVVEEAFDDESYIEDPAAMGVLSRVAKVGAALAVFAVASTLLFSSFNSDSDGESDPEVVDMDMDPETREVASEPIVEPASDVVAPDVKQLQEKIQAYEEKERERKRQADKSRSKAAAKKARSAEKKKNKNLKKRRAEEAKAKAAAKRSVAAKKKTPKKAKPKLKPKPKPKPAPVAKAKPARGGVPSPMGGTFRARSFFLQRDRKALFYTALDAERLVAELESSYQELKRNKSGWKSFYRGWKSNLRSSTPSLIRNFPNSREDYAYPRELAAFKKDYGLLEGYGALHNAKVLRLRIPASPGKNLGQVFSGHRDKAKNLRHR